MHTATRAAAQGQKSLDEYFSQVLRAVYMDRRLSNAQCRVFGYLATYPHPERGCWPMRETIAADLGMTGPVVSRHLHALQRLGYLEIVKRAGKKRDEHKRNLYRIRMGTPSSGALSAPRE